MLSESTRTPGFLRGGRLTQAIPYLFATGLYLAIALLVRIRRAGPDWDAFMRVTDQALSGDFFHIYANRFHEYHAFAYPPASIVLLMPFRWVANTLALGSEVSNVFVIVPFICSDIVCAYMMTRFVNASPEQLSNKRLGAFVVFLMSWVLLFSTPYHGHFESLLIFILLSALLCLQHNRVRSAAILFGLGFLTKQTAIAVILPVCISFVLRREWMKLFWMAALGGGLVLAIMLPFFVVDQDNVMYMLVGLPALIPVAFQSSWMIFSNPSFGWIKEAVRPYVNAGILLTSAIYSLWRVRRDIGEHRASDLMGICAACCVIVTLAQKWGSLHYFLLPFALLFVWELTMRDCPIPWVSMLFISTLSNIFMLFLSSEVKLEFNAATAAIQIMVCAGVLVYISIKRTNHEHVNLI